MHWVFTAALGLSLAAAARLLLPAWASHHTESPGARCQWFSSSAHRQLLQRHVASSRTEGSDFLCISRQILIRCAARSSPLFLILTGELRSSAQAQKLDCECFWPRRKIDHDETKLRKRSKDAGSQVRALPTPLAGCPLNTTDNHSGWFGNRVLNHGNV